MNDQTIKKGLVTDGINKLTELTDTRAACILTQFQLLISLVVIQYKLYLNYFKKINLS